LEGKKKNVSPRGGGGKTTNGAAPDGRTRRPLAIQPASPLRHARHQLRPGQYRAAVCPRSRLRDQDPAAAAATKTAGQQSGGGLAPDSGPMPCPPSVVRGNCPAIQQLFSNGRLRAQPLSGSKNPSPPTRPSPAKHLNRRLANQRRPLLVAEPPLPPARGRWEMEPLSAASPSTVGQRARTQGADRSCRKRDLRHGTGLGKPDLSGAFKADAIRRAGLARNRWPTWPPDRTATTAHRDVRSTCGDRWRRSKTTWLSE